MIRAGIIGLGVGEQHIVGYEKHPACKVVALCDFDPEKKKLAQEKYPQIPFYERAEELLANPEIDLVSIASFDNFHYSQISQAIDFNKHIFVEKPLCLYKHEAQSLRLKLEQKPYLQLSSNLILRKTPRFIELKNMIQHGQMGEVFYVEGDYNYGRLHKITEGWRGQLDFYSIVYGGGIHLIDLLLWLLEDDIVEVTAQGNQITSKETAFKFNDLVISLLKFKSGVLGKMTVNFGCVYPHFHPLAIYGTQATFINGKETAQLYTSPNPQVEPQLISTPYPGTEKGDLLYSFVEAILNSTTPEITKEDVFRSMSVCLAIEEACQQNKTVQVEYI